MSDIFQHSDITITDRDSQRILKILSPNHTQSALRISVSGGGCSGFQYNFEIIQNRKEVFSEDDLLFEKNGACIIVDKVSIDFIKGAEIDFVDDLIGQSFKINNPNATSSCGCGTSFSI